LQELPLECSLSEQAHLRLRTDSLLRICSFEKTQELEIGTEFVIWVSPTRVRTKISSSNVLDYTRGSQRAASGISSVPHRSPQNFHKTFLKIETFTLYVRPIFGFLCLAISHHSKVVYLIFLKKYGVRAKKS